jgi:hypothetical protein
MTKAIVESAMTEMKFRWITIRQVNKETFEGHPVYRIFNNKSRDQIGILSWYKPWRQTVFSSEENCVFNDACLRDVLTFIDSII